jgi:peptidoglycan/xylan/chitin deacetylase (PgdA/CDA1 family)
VEGAHDQLMLDLFSTVYKLFVPSATFSRSDDAVYLTFDDGPHPTATPTVLDILSTFRVKSTFFLLGSHARQFPRLARDIAADGHAIGNHSYHHINLAFRGKELIHREITTANDAIIQASGVTPKLFRPPFGFFGPRTVNIVESLGMRLVHWSNDPRDFEMTRDDQRSVAKIVRRIDKGSIVLLHDNDATADTIAAFLPLFITALQDRGLTFSSLD